VATLGLVPFDKLTRRVVTELTREGERLPDQGAQALTVGCRFESGPLLFRAAVVQGRTRRRND
jgi:hypothetical protein